MENYDSYSNTTIIEWFDREVCSVCINKKGNYLLHWLNDWDPNRRIGVRLHCEIPKRLYETLQHASYESCKVLVTDFVATNLNVVIASLVGDDDRVVRQREFDAKDLITQGVQISPCDLDQTMMARNLFIWERII